MNLRPFDFIVSGIFRLAQRTPYFNLTHDSDGSPYMDRWWLMPRFMLERDDATGRYKPKAWCPFAIRLHHIRSSDADRYLHDHPWSYATWILRGGYWEERPESIDPRWCTYRGIPRERVRRAFHGEGAILFRRATDRHVLKLVPGTTAWTLFFQWRKVQPWGFYTPRGKVYWWLYDHVTAQPEAPARRRVTAISGDRRG